MKDAVQATHHSLAGGVNANTLSMQICNHTATS